MRSTLAIGLASGVWLWLLAAFSAAFVMIVPWVVESFEPQARRTFMLNVQAADPAVLEPKLEAPLTRHRLQFGLRSSTVEALTCEVDVPIERFGGSAVERHAIPRTRPVSSGVRRRRSDQR